MNKITGVFLLAVMLAVPTMAFAASEVPPGFIAVSESRMNWADATAWCATHGGRLPRINNSDSWNYEGKATIEGFGTQGSPSWPPGLPGGFYWTGTVDTAPPGLSLFVYNIGDYVYVARQHGNLILAACVR